MKKTILLLFLLTTTFGFSQKKEKVKGSKVVTMEQKQIENFKSIEVEDNLEVFLVKGNECGLEIEADDNLHEFIDYKLSGSNLRITTNKDISSFKKLSVRITYTDELDMVIAKNETNVTALSDVDLKTVTFKSYDYAKLYLNAKCKNFTLMANDKSKIELNLKSEKAAIDVSKNAQVKALIASTDLLFDMYQKSTAIIEGDVNTLKLRLDNNSDFNGSKLTAVNTQLFAEAYSNGKINAKTNIVIDIAGKSEIEIFGEPKFEIKRFTDSATLRKKPIK
ncbi:GIN domain-containing protein [Flavobacterium macrobrachii]|jgi:Putative auto-transporter adhesin, head GIN domain|uniref:DUF2807 domain-containing protein n=1 Tax=Flavobacterium macrobrachii TaxID=591204 RepID=A0ABS2CZK4_9FLAO|nr:DUF2807 domain-containing protein [Flavobacterium macrobrachii]MBM6500388.1 DUF2807 domain-containing protein [Flavobacterium macrobrachii]